MHLAKPSALRAFDPAFLVTGAVAVSVFAITYDNGTYGIVSRGVVAIVLWWAIAMGFAFDLFQLSQLTRMATVIAGLLAAFCLWILLSIAWSSSAEGAFNEFNRVSLFLAVFLFVSAVAARGKVDRWVDGLTLAIAAIAVVALSSRLFPGLFPDRGIFDYLPTAAIRLNFPLGYWNGLATFVGFGVPLALRSALDGGRLASRAIAIALLPIAASVIYLASSRGGMLTAILGAAIFFALSDRRWSTAGALLVGGLGSFFAIWALKARNHLVEGPLGTDVVEREGRTAALLIVLICALTAVIYGLCVRFLGERLHPGRRLGQGLLVAGALALVIGLVASHPIRRFEQFKRLPAEPSAVDSAYFSNAHLFSGSGTGRWQMWSSAADQWQEHPVVGNGAGSFQEWWAQNGNPRVTFVKDAHSLYLETLGELGLVGFLILISIFALSVLVAVRKTLDSDNGRLPRAALAAAFGAYSIEVAFDWMWELTAVSLVAFAFLALLLSQSRPLSRQAKPKLSGWIPILKRRAPAVAIVTAALVMIGAQSIPTLARMSIEESQAAVDRGDALEAEDAALRARRIQPWASSPSLQLALVFEREGNLPQARVWIEEAIRHDESNWSLWLVLARIDVNLGQPRQALKSLERAIELNPHSQRMIRLEQTLHKTLAKRPQPQLEAEKGAST